MPGGVKALAAYMGAWFAVEAHGEDATPAHAQNLVFEGKRRTPEEFARAAVAAERDSDMDGWDGFTDDQVADVLLTRLERTEEPEG